MIQKYKGHFHEVNQYVCRLTAKLGFRQDLAKRVQCV